MVYPWAHSPLVSNVQSLLHYMYVSFLAIGTGCVSLGYRPCWCPSPLSLRLPNLGYFSSTLLRLPLDFIHVSSLGPVWYENLSGVVSCPENSNINIDGLDSVVIGSRDQ